MAEEHPSEHSLTTIGDYLTWATDYFAEQDLFYGHGTDNPWDEAVMLVLYVLQLPASNNSSLLQQELSVAQKKRLIELAQLRVATRKPVPYLTNDAWFAGEKYYVTEDVLIPRSPLAETILNLFQPWLGNTQPHTILDLCTGSGCLAILCAKQFPEAQVFAADISAEALAVTEINIQLHKCADRVQPVLSDLFANLSGRKFDIIISNPPYVGQQEMQELPYEFKHEPELALASGVDGLDITRLILRQAKQFLTPSGILIVEVGNSWQTLVDMYPEIPFTWLEFAHGGDGVFLLTADQVQAIQI